MQYIEIMDTATNKALEILTRVDVGLLELLFRLAGNALLA